MRLTPRDRLFVLTGAGISTESGLATFRGSGGLWNGYRVEEVATPEAWESNSALVWNFYSQRRRDAAAALPNKAHLALAQIGAATRRPLLPLHPERRRPARTRRLPPPPPHARLSLSITLHSLQPALSRHRPLHHRRQSSCLRQLRRSCPPPHRLVRRDPPGHGRNLPRTQSSHRSSCRRNLRLCLPRRRVRRYSQSAANPHHLRRSRIAH